MVSVGRVRCHQQGTERSLCVYANSVPRTRQADRSCGSWSPAVTVRWASLHRPAAPAIASATILPVRRVLAGTWQLARQTGLERLAANSRLCRRRLPEVGTPLAVTETTFRLQTDGEGQDAAYQLAAETLACNMATEDAQKASVTHRAQHTDREGPQAAVSAIVECVLVAATGHPMLNANKLHGLILGQRRRVWAPQPPISVRKKSANAAGGMGRLYR